MTCNPPKSYWSQSRSACQIKPPLPWRLQMKPKFSCSSSQLLWQNAKQNDARSKRDFPLHCFYAMLLQVAQHGIWDVSHVCHGIDLCADIHSWRVVLTLGLKMSNKFVSMSFLLSRSSLNTSQSFWKYQAEACSGCFSHHLLHSTPSTSEGERGVCIHARKYIHKYTY